MSKIRIAVNLLLLASMIPIYAQNQIILELKKPATVGASIPIKFKRYKKGKLKRIRKKSLKVRISAGRYENKRIVLPFNVDNFQNHQIKVLYSWSVQPSIWYDTLINVGYSGKVIADYSGRSGRKGDKGGGRFRLGLFVIGRNGYDGNEGEPGQSGKDGQDIEVTLDVYYDSLLQVKLLKAVVNSKNTLGKDTYLVNTNEGKLIIRANGGNGGNGGRGGSGGNGKNAKGKTEKKRSKAPGSGGDGGDGGSGGDGGNAGRITILVKPNAREFMHLVKAINLCGKKGYGGSCGSFGNGGVGGYGYSEGEDGSAGRNGDNGSEGRLSTEPEIIYLEN